MSAADGSTLLVYQGAWRRRSAITRRLRPRVAYQTIDHQTLHSTSNGHGPLYDLAGAVAGLPHLRGLLGVQDRDLGRGSAGATRSATEAFRSVVTKASSYPYPSSSWPDSRTSTTRTLLGVEDQP